MALTINQKIEFYVRGNLGKQVGDGECWTLAEKALAQAGAQTSNDIMGASNVTPDADYVWGDAIAYKDIIPGDILQLRDYTMITKTVVSVLYKNLPPGVQLSPNPMDESEDEASFSQPHHTSIAVNSFDNNFVSVMHQNVDPNGKKVQQGNLAVASIPAKSSVKNDTRVLKIDAKDTKVNVTVTTTVTVTVSGTIWAYRPRMK